MSILIKGMKMPNGCHLCPFANEYDECCINEFLEDQHEITHYCHLIELPDHGDLIERDAAYDSIAEQEGGNYIDMDAVYAGLQDAPTVIPAERSEE